MPCTPAGPQQPAYFFGTEKFHLISITYGLSSTSTGYFLGTIAFCTAILRVITPVQPFANENLSESILYGFIKCHYGTGFDSQSGMSFFPGINGYSTSLILFPWNRKKACRQTRQAFSQTALVWDEILAPTGCLPDRKEPFRLFRVPSPDPVGFPCFAVPKTREGRFLPFFCRRQPRWRPSKKYTRSETVSSRASPPFFGNLPSGDENAKSPFPNLNPNSLPQINFFCGRSKIFLSKPLMNSPFRSFP
jgi:hypothetical protein